MRACFKKGEAISLRRILKSVTKKVHQSLDIDIKARGCTDVAEEVRHGDIFFAIPHSERRSDASDDCGDEIADSVGLAIHRGAAAIVADRPVVGAADVPYFIVPDIIEAFGAFCHALYGNPAKSIKLIGVTGTSGKTSTSCLISSMLAESGHSVGLITSLGVFDGEEFHSIATNVMTPIDIAHWIQRCVLNGCTHLVLEVSSQMIAEGTLSGIKLDAVCLTNIKRDNLDYHKTVVHYRRTQFDIFKYAKKKAIVLCNIDDKVSEAILPFIENPLLTVGMKGMAEIGAMVIESSPYEQTFVVTAGTEAVPFCTKIIGKEHIYNSLLAIGLGIAFSLDLRQIARGIERVETIPNRMERIECGQEFPVFIDSARTTDSLTRTLKTVRSVTQGNLICVFGAGEHHEKERRCQMSQAIQTYADSIIVTSSAVKPLDSATATAIFDISKGFTETGAIKTMPSRVDAMAWALSVAKPGDSVLMIGNNDHEVTDIESEAVLFSDRYFAKEWFVEQQLIAS